MDIAIDNSALSNVLGIETKEAALVRRLKRATGDRLLISLEALGESLSQLQLEAVQRRALAIDRLFTRLGDAVALTPGGMELIYDYEWKSLGLKQVQALPPSEQESILSHLRSPSFLQDHGPVATRLRAGLRKDAADAMDRSAKTAFARLLSYQPTQANLMMAMDTLPKRVLAPGAHFLTLVARDERHAELIRNKPFEYRAAVTLIGYSELNALGSLFASIGHGRYHTVLRASRRGEWVDACIGSASAYADVLVTDDRVMIAKTNYIADALQLRTRAIGLEEYLG